MVHTTRNRKAGYDLLARRFSRHFVQRFPPSRRIYKPEWDTWLRWMYVTAILLNFPSPGVRIRESHSFASNQMKAKNRITDRCEQGAGFLLLMVSLRYLLRSLVTYSSLIYRKVVRRHGGQQKRSIFCQLREWRILDVLARSLGLWQRRKQSC